MKEEKRVIYLDYLRIIATFFVIILHISGQNIANVSINSLDFHVMNIFDSLSRFTVPMFVMISGTLFLNPKKNFSTKKLFTKNIFRLLTAFVFWSLIYTILSHLKHPKGIISFIFDFALGYYHLWFVYMLIGLYIITPILRKIVESKVITKYFLILSVVVNFIIPISLEIVGIQYLNSIYNNIGLNLLFGYSFYYILGYYLSIEDIKSNWRKIIYFLGIFGALATIVLTFIISRESNVLKTVFYDNFSITILFQSIALYVFAKYKMNDIKIDINKITKISNCCFGIYLIHALIINILNIFNINTLTIHPLISIPLLSIIVYIISFILTFILNKIPIINKYIV